MPLLGIRNNLWEAGWDLGLLCSSVNSEISFTLPWWFLSSFLWYRPVSYCSLFRLKTPFWVFQYWSALRPVVTWLTSFLYYCCTDIKHICNILWMKMCIKASEVAETCLVARMIAAHLLSFQKYLVLFWKSFEGIGLTKKSL